MMILAALLLSTSATPRIEVNGDAYLRLVRDGRMVFAKTAKLTCTQGKLTNEFGDAFLPTVTLDPSAKAVSVDPDGTVRVDGAISGRLTLATFPAGTALQPRGGVLVSVERATTIAAGLENGPSIKTVTEATSVPAKANPQPSTSGGSAIKVHGRNWVAKESVELDKDTISALDVIENPGSDSEKLAAIDLGSTPALGLSRKLDREFILGRIRAAGYKSSEFSWSQAGPSITISRKSQTIPQADFAKAALDELAKRTPGVEYSPIGSFADYAAPTGANSLQVEEVLGLGTSTASVRIGIMHEGKRLNARTLRFEVKTAPIVVKSGRSVQVILRAGGAAIVLQGIAKESGALGAKVSVEVQPDSKGPKTVHMGVVIGADTVEVRL